MRSRLRSHENGDVARVVLEPVIDEPDVAQAAAHVSDGGREAPEVAGPVENHDPDGLDDLVYALFYLHGDILIQANSFLSNKAGRVRMAPRRPETRPPRIRPAAVRIERTDI